MGTKVQFDNHLPGLCSMRDLNHDSDGTHWPLFYGENNLPNRQYYNGLSPRPVADSSPDANKDTMKQTILKHESVFKNQVIELHRLYRVQKDLMDEFHRQEQYKHRIPYEAASSSSVFPSHMTPEDAHRRNSSSFLFANSVCEGPQSRPKKLRKMIDLELPADGYVDADEVDQQSSLHVFNNGEKLFPSHLGKSECKNDVSESDTSSRKPSILADLNEPLLSEETNVNPFVNNLPWNSNKGNMNGTIKYDVKEAGIKDDVRSIRKTDHVGEEASMSSSPAHKSHQPSFLLQRAHPNKGDMWHMINQEQFYKAARGYVNGRYVEQETSGSSNFLKGSHLLDLNAALPNGISNKPLANQGVNNVDCEVKREDPLFQKPSSIEDETESGRRKWLIDINLPCDDPEAFDDVAAPSEVMAREKTEIGKSSSVRNMIDLNSCVVEDETSFVERAMIIDLEAPVNLETEEDEGLARVAAEAIVSISSCTGTIAPCSIEEASGSEDALQWFVNIVCSARDDDKDCCLSSESDYLEEMTLKLTECTVEEYFPSPPVLNVPAMEEPSPSTVAGRIRRGPARRGRQRRDFQRDILPGLTSLARNEVTEDLQTFGGLMTATGHAWNSGTRRNASRNGSGRGRRRAVVAIPPPLPPPVASLMVETTAFGSQKSGEMMVEDRSLSSWGKTTRRPRRQRCPSATPGNLTSVAFT